MPHLTMEHLRTLLLEREAPCISLYQPTPRQHPDKQQNPIRFKNLLRAVEDSLGRMDPPPDMQALLEPLQALASQSAFWNHTCDGLALFACPGFHTLFHLQRVFPARVVVADRFHVKPLLRYVQSADRFQVLGLTRDRAMVFAGNRYALDALSLADDFPSRREQVVSVARTEPGVAVASTSAGIGSPQMLRGYGEKEEANDTEKFFRAVDRAVTVQYSKPSGLPLVLASLPEHQALFRRVSQNPGLLVHGVHGNPGALTADTLRQQVWQVLEPYYLARLEGLTEQYRAAVARQVGSADLSDVARAAVANRVETLLVEADRLIPGVIDHDTGAIRPGELVDPQVGDLLNALAALVLRKGGDVVVVPPERMPASSGLAAIYRF